ncbi:hypothetical protein E4T39_06535 [Aureobasidium subglaciale]|nr:hypothetical protein E4T39_06535 [Aureobasidium subglaciale]
MASIPDLHVHKLGIRASCLLLAIDYLFVKDGSKGLHKFTSRSQPVKISLSGDVEKGAKEMMHDEKRGSEGGAAYVEDVRKPISHSGVTSTGGAVLASGRF